LVENHFIKTHFIESQKVDQKYSGWSLRQQYLWRSLPMDTNACGGGRG
jgi:hypothetical protein